MEKIIFTVIYLFIMSVLAYKGYKGTKNSKDYLLAGRQIHPVIMALSYGAAFVSTSAIIGFGGYAGVFGMSLHWLTFMTIFVGVFVAFIFFGKRTRRMGHNIQAHTFPEFLAKRYQSKAIQKFSGSIIFVFMPLYAAAVMIGAAKFIEKALAIGYVPALFFVAVIVAVYVFFGGLKGVMYADAFQGGLMFVGMLFLICYTYTKLGGITAAHETLSAMIQQADVMAQTGKFPPGFRGWTAMPETGSINWLIVVTSITLGVGVGVLAQPQLAVKFMTVKSNRELNRGVTIGGIFVLMMTGVAFQVGALSNAFFYQETGKIAVVAAGGTDQIMPAFLETYTPGWFVSIFLVVLIAAGMSTMSSQFHAIATAFGRDLMPSRVDSAKQMLITRIGVLIAFVITLLLAWGLPLVWNAAIGIATTLFFGICAASFLPAYAAALYSKCIARKAVIIGMISGFSVSLFWMLFFFKKTASVVGLCQAVAGKVTLVADTGCSNLMFVDPIVIALTVAALTTVVCRFICKPDIEEKHLDHCFSGIDKSK